MEPLSRTFRNAAAGIRRGWVQGMWRDEDGNVCLLQAVSEALGVKGVAVPLPMEMQLLLDSQLMLTGTYCCSVRQQEKRSRLIEQGKSLEKLIYGWNDTKGRTSEEVEGVLEAIGDRLEGEEYREYIRGLISRAVRPATWFSQDRRTQLVHG